MKKVVCTVIAVVMVAAMVLSLSGCGGPKIALPTSATLSFGDDTPILSTSANVNCEITEITATENGDVLLKGTCTITSTMSSFGRGKCWYQLYYRGLFDGRKTNSKKFGEIKWMNSGDNTLTTYGDGTTEAFEITLYNNDEYAVSEKKPICLYCQYTNTWVTDEGASDTNFHEIANLTLTWE